MHFLGYIEEWAFEISPYGILAEVWTQFKRAIS